MACGLSKSIVSILGGGECDISSNTLSAPSFRRNFSSDFSSKNLLSHNGFSPMKRISSSEKLRAFGTVSLSFDDAEADEGSRSGFDIWTHIQEDKNKNEKEIEPGQSDIWSSILSDKKKMESSNDTVPPPYVHPLMKRSSSLSEKSLEICTESLGSETGCEGFSSYASSETGDAEIEKEINTQEETILVPNLIDTKEEETEAVIEQESVTAPIHKTCIELPQGSFPPPIRSLSSQSGTFLHMKTRRDNGRLVLEAVSMPSQNNFSAKRQNGRLLLTFSEINSEPNYEVDIASDKEDEIDSEVQWFDEEEEEEEEAKDELVYKTNGLINELAQKPIIPINVHRLAYKPIGVAKKNSKCPVTDKYKTKYDQSTPIVHSLPPRPRVAQLARSIKPPSTVDDSIGASCFNTCDYYWKPTNIETSGPNAKTQLQAQNLVNKPISIGFDGWTNGCKGQTLLSIDSFCIATS